MTCNCCNRGRTGVSGLMNGQVGATRAKPRFYPHYTRPAPVMPCSVSIFVMQDIALFDLPKDSGYRRQPRTGANLYRQEADS
jgi:hypothetical protein